MYIPKSYKQDVYAHENIHNTFIQNRAFFHNLLASNYDITKKCNLSCEGCLFFDGEDYLAHHDNVSLEEWELFFQKEKSRGVNFPYFAGAEPSLVQERLLVATKYFAKGVVYTNGSIVLDKRIHFKIHISVWGEPEDEIASRNGSFFLQALQNYKDDPRAVFVYTIHAMNIDKIESIIKHCREWHAKLTFNLFSPTTEYLSIQKEEQRSLILTPNKLQEIREKLDDFINKYPDVLIYTKEYNHYVTNPNGLYEIDATTQIAQNCAIRNEVTAKHFRTDLSSHESKCCYPNIDCTQCRTYAVSLGMAVSKYKTLLKTYDGFIEWNAIAKQWRELLVM